MNKFLVTGLLLVVVAVHAVDSADETVTFRPYDPQDHYDIWYEFLQLKPLIQEAMTRDRKLRDVLNRLNDVFEPAVLSGKPTKDIDWRQVIESATSEVRAINVSTPVNQALDWIYAHEDVTLPISDSMIEIEDVEHDLLKYSERSERMTKALLALSKAEAETRGSEDRILRLASIFYHSLGWKSVAEDVNAKNESAMLQEALDIVSENQDAAPA